MRVDWLEFVIRVHEFLGLNLGQRMANVTEVLLFTLRSLKSADRLWGPQSLQFNGYRISFPGIK